MASEPPRQLASSETRRQLADVLAPAMFFLALIFLAIVAMLIVIWVDMPRMIEPVTEESGETHFEVVAAHNFWLENTALEWSHWGIGCLMLLWPFFIAEFAMQFVLRDRAAPFWRVRYFSLFTCACPPLRMCARNHDAEGMIWLPGRRWCVVDERLRDDLERTFSIPMIIIALMILPVLVVEFGLSSQVQKHLWLRMLLHAGTGMIWFAFAAEFILMLSAADKKLRYCREHWIDLAIILLPLLSFLRSLRIVRTMRLARYAKVKQLTKMGRLYRLRGLAMRAFRGILILELLDRFIRVDPEKRLARLRSQLVEKEREADTLRQVIAKIEAEVQAAAVALDAAEEALHADSLAKSAESPQESSPGSETEAADLQKSLPETSSSPSINSDGSKAGDARAMEQP